MLSTKCTSCGKHTWSSTKTMCLDCKAIKIWKKFEVLNLPHESRMAYGQYQNNPGLNRTSFVKTHVI